MLEPRVGEASKSTDRPHYEFHPLQMVVIAFMIASLAVFLYVLVAYVATREDASVALSNYFVISSLTLLLSGQGLQTLKYHFDKERTHHLLAHLSLIITSGLAFLTFQYLGWIELSSERLITPVSALSFLYILLIAHAGIMLGVLLITLLTIIGWATKLKDPVGRLVFFSNRYQRLKLVLFHQVWFFLQGTWVSIFLTFLLTN